MKIKATNTILYCRNWEATVEFYRTGLKLPVLSSNEWFVEFKLNESSRVSVANEARGKAAFTELFQQARTTETPISVERIVDDIDDIVRKIRFEGWQALMVGSGKCGGHYAEHLLNTSSIRMKSCLKKRMDMSGNIIRSGHD